MVVACISHLFQNVAETIRQTLRYTCGVENNDKINNTDLLVTIEIRYRTYSVTPKLARPDSPAAATPAGRRTSESKQASRSQIERIKGILTISVVGIRVVLNCKKPEGFNGLFPLSEHFYSSYLLCGRFAIT